MPAGNNKEQNVAAVQDTKENKKKLGNKKEQEMDQNRESILDNCGIIRRVRAIRLSYYFIICHTPKQALFIILKKSFHISLANL